MAQFIIGDNNLWIDDDIYIKYIDTKTPKEMVEFAIPYADYIKNIEEINI